MVTETHIQATKPVRRDGWLAQLASPGWTLIFFLLTAVSVLGVSQAGLPATALMFAPFALLTLNLGAAIASMPRFRRDLPLLVFHLALLLLVMLFIAARLTYLDAAASVTRGETFSGQLLNDERGPLHGDTIGRVRFTNLGFSEIYPVGSPYRITRNRVQWEDDQGRTRRLEIGSDQPLVIDGYRIYTTRIRGYAPVFLWQDKEGTETLGQVQLNNAVDGETPPVNEWQLPNGTQVWAMLDQGDDSLAGFAPNMERVDRENLGADRLDHRLVLRIDEVRHELEPGELIVFEDGTLTYLKLEAWMGYRIVYDPTQPWLIATVAVGVLSLVWFYARQLFRRTQWDSDR